MTTNSITSDQKKQFKRFVEDASNRALEKINPDKDGLQRLLEHGGEFQAHIVAGINRFTTKAPDYGLAQSILGADFITPEEVSSACTSIVYTDEQITALAESLLSEDVLKWCKDNGYVVIPAPPTAMSTLDVREIQSAHFYSKTGDWYSDLKSTAMSRLDVREIQSAHFYSRNGGWYLDQKFAHEDKTSFGWLAIRKKQVPHSTNKTWNEQGKLLSALESALERVPNAAEMSWSITTYFEVRGIRLFENIYVRTSSLGSDGRRVCVGGFDLDGLYISCWHDVLCSVGIGLSSARK